MNLTIITTILVTIITLADSAITDQGQHNQFSTTGALDDKLFLDNVIFDLDDTRSMFDCSRFCADTSDCVSFTLYNGVKSQGHKVVLTPTSSSTLQVAAKTFVRGLYLVVFFFLCGNFLITLILT